MDKQRRYPALEWTVMHAFARTVPTGRKRIEWKLATHLSATSRKQVVEKFNCYVLQ
ncbi:hypothetical protein [Mycetohabitans endofungorum]|uniref:hypothetical protein n=1 Tax=Mycetohabitans endofungorum TaxID=417203 RepID=UPI0030D167D8